MQCGGDEQLWRYMWVFSGVVVQKLMNITEAEQATQVKFTQSSFKPTITAPAIMLIIVFCGLILLALK